MDSNRIAITEDFNGGKYMCGVHRRVLVITKAYQTANISKHWDKHTRQYYQDCDVIFLSITKCLQDDLKRCCEIVKTKSINCVISINDSSSLLHGALVETFQHQLQGPTLESLFLIQHKYYTRHLIGSQADLNIPYCLFTKSRSINGISNIDHYIAKPVSGSTSKGLRVFKSKIELLKFCRNKSALDDVDVIHSQLTLLVKMFIKDAQEKYNLENGYIIEEYVPHLNDLGNDGATFHALECLVNDGRAIPWSTCDNLYFSHRPECFLGNIMPSTLSQRIQEKAWRVMYSLAAEITKYGFNNHFLQGELIVFPNGNIKLMELNSHMSGWKIPMHTTLYENGDPIKASLDLANGSVVKQPKLKSNDLGIHAIVTIYGEGPASDFIDLNLARTFEEIELLVSEETVIYDQELSGYVVAYVCCYDKTVQQCLKLVKDIIKQILKVPNASPWFEHCLVT